MRREMRSTGIVDKRSFRHSSTSTSSSMNRWLASSPATKGHHHDQAPTRAAHFWTPPGVGIGHRSSSPWQPNAIVTTTSYNYVVLIIIPTLAWAKRVRSAFRQKDKKRKKESKKSQAFPATLCSKYIASGHSITPEAGQSACRRGPSESQLGCTDALLLVKLADLQRCMVHV